MAPHDIFLVTSLIVAALIELVSIVHTWREAPTDAAQPTSISWISKTSVLLGGTSPARRDP